MAKGFWLKNHPDLSWKTVTALYVKISPSSWQSVNDAWVKIKQTGTGAWQRFWSSATNPDSPIEILTSFTTTTELLRLQGKNYHWTPNPSTLFYKFTYVNNSTTTTYTLTSSTSTSNPSSGSSITLPSASTYRTISKNTADNEFAIGGLSTYKFTVTGTTSNGSISVQSAEYSMRTPAAPNVAVEQLSVTSLKLTITPKSTEDGYVTGRYIVYTSDAVGGLIESGGGRGGYAYANPKVVTLTGLTAGRTYSIYVAPFTGSSGSTTANASGYAGAEAYVSTQTIADYTFTFGKTLHIGTNGYISLDSGSASDAVSSTNGKVIGIFPIDLQQSTTTSIWYWSNTTQFIIRWEGYVYGNSSNLREYEAIFDINNNYVSVYAINVTSGASGTQAYLKDGIALTSYSAALTTGNFRYVYFDSGTSPTTQFGPYLTKSKSVMKQVTGLTSGSTDQGYTSIVTSTNQNVIPTLGAFNVSSFTKGTVAASSQGAARSTTLTWGASTDATRYEVQYQGSNDNTNWTTVQTYAQSAYNTGTTETKTWSSQAGGDFTFYTYMRANIRASEDTATSTVVYSNAGSYVDASGVAPGQPTFGTITKTGTTASIPFTVGTTGTNFLYTSIEYMYKTSTGSYPTTWSTSVITNGAGTISLSGLSSSTTYYIKIRTRNYDELYSSENETNFATNAGLSSPTISTVTYNTSTGVWTVNYTGGSGPFYQIWYQPVTIASIPTLTATDASRADASSNSSTSTNRTASAASGYAYWWWVRSANTLDATGSGNVSAWNGPVTMSPINTAIPTLTGTAKVGQILTYGTGTWINATSNTTQLYRGTASVNTNETFVTSTTSASGTYTIPSSDFTDANNRKYYRSFSRGENASFNSSYVAGTEIGPLVNITLYTITFNSNSGTAVSALTQSTEGGSISKPTDPTRTSYTFGGWTTTDGGSTAVTWPRTPTASETLYAKWDAALATPTSLTATTNDKTKIRLTWSGGSGTTTMFYWAGLNTTRPLDSSTFADFTTDNASPFDYTTMARGSNYYFFVKSRNGTSPNYTYSTTWFPAAAPGVNGRAPLYAPGTPTSPSATANSSTQITFSWTAPTTPSPNPSGPDAASGYDIYYSTSTTDPTSTTSATTTSTTASKAITGLSSSTQYYFWVRATNADNTGSSASSWTARVTATTSAAFTTPAWNGTMPTWTASSPFVNGNNFRRNASSLQYGWNNGSSTTNDAFSFSGSVGTSKGWDFYWSTTQPASTTTVRTATHTFAHSTSTSGTQIGTTSFIYRVNPTYTSSSVYGSIRPYQYGTDGNKYVRGSYPDGTWSASI
jgi:hypothetical protein